MQCVIVLSQHLLWSSFPAQCTEPTAQSSVWCTPVVDGHPVQCTGHQVPWRHCFNGQWSSQGALLHHRWVAFHRSLHSNTIFPWTTMHLPMAPSWMLRALYWKPEDAAGYEEPSTQDSPSTLILHLVDGIYLSNKSWNFSPRQSILLWILPMKL